MHEIISRRNNGGRVRVWRWISADIMEYFLDNAVAAYIELTPHHDSWNNSFELTGSL